MSEEVMMENDKVKKVDEPEAPAVFVHDEDYYTFDGVFRAPTLKQLKSVLANKEFRDVIKRIRAEQKK